VRLVSWEVWEAKTPMRVDNAEFAVDSCGTGQFRGGPGIDLVLTALTDMELTVVNERSQVPPFALTGGTRGRRNQVVLQAPGAEPAELTKETGVSVPKGSRITVMTGGGAGYGPHSDRDHGAVQQDVGGGYLSEARARTEFPDAFKKAAS
jgi:N-methylhydantoinase B